MVYGTYTVRYTHAESARHCQTHSSCLLCIYRACHSFSRDRNCHRKSLICRDVPSSQDLYLEACM